MKIIIESRIDDFTGLRAGDDIDAIMRALKEVRDRVWNADDPAELRDGEIADREGKPIGHFHFEREEGRV